jgi:hypothetical protein
VVLVGNAFASLKFEIKPDQQLSVFLTVFTTASCVRSKFDACSSAGVQTDMPGDDEERGFEISSQRAWNSSLGCDKQSELVALLN